VSVAPALLLLALFGASVALSLAPLRIASPPAALVRTNFRGRSVPAVLGDALLVAGLLTLGAAAVAGAGGWIGDEPSAEVFLAVLVVLVVFGIAGSWDDRKGDERPRGFKGHLGALRTGRVTGGLVKLMAGGLAGLAAGAILFEGAAEILQTGAIIALAANLINLLDRAPGRAAKVCLLVGLPLVILGARDWALAAAGSLGALAGVVRFDLSERAMLGDAGANPLGALLGLGLALGLGSGGRWVTLLVLLVANAASERWSFSRAIDAWAPLRWLDRLGRET
jgi:UDP-N-acetylmuramyl pentapeptide phosphotransferase/UDP-N-acetylglucosamine-1-phosphate transferase